MKQWELRGITIDDAPPSTSGSRPESPRASDAEPQIVVDRFPMVFWTTDGELGFTSSPAPGVLHLGLPPVMIAKPSRASAAASRRAAP